MSAGTVAVTERLVEARQAIAASEDGHCGCCDNDEAERLAKVAMADLLEVAVHALRGVESLDEGGPCIWSWGGDECPRENAEAMLNDLRRDVVCSMCNGARQVMVSPEGPLTGCPACASGEPQSNADHPGVI